MEGLFHTLKTELVMNCDLKTRDQLRASLFEWTCSTFNDQLRGAAAL
ncbi:IS3 family transposase [Paraburkholderia sp.]